MPMVQLKNSFSDELVIVTHIESPTLFYCRAEQDLDRHEELARLIRQQVDTEPYQVPKNTALNASSNLLIFSVIHNDWCRGRLISCKRANDQKLICAKVCLLDYGSIEFVSWKPDYVRPSTSEIDNFNDAKGLCFPCCLFNIKPCNESKDSLENQYDWSSYANYMFKKQTIHSKFRLKVIKTNTINDKIVICDLFPVDCSLNPVSLSHYLVKSNVAQYINFDVHQR